MIDFFSKIWRLLKTVAVVIPIFIFIVFLDGLFDGFLSSTLGVAVFLSLAVSIINWVGVDLLNFSFMKNVLGRFFRRSFYFIAWIVAAFLQIGILSSIEGNGIAGNLKLFSGNGIIVDAFILVGAFAPHVIMYFNYVASLSEYPEDSNLWYSVPISLVLGGIIGLAVAIIFAIFPGLKSVAMWLIPVLSNGAIIVLMIVKRALPFTDTHESEFNDYF